MEKQVKAEEEKLGSKVQALTEADRKEIYQKGSTNFTGLSWIYLMFKAPKTPTCRGFEELDPDVLLLQRSGAAGCSEPNSGRLLFTCTSSI